MPFTKKVINNSFDYWEKNAIMYEAMDGFINVNLDISDPELVNEVQWSYESIID
jgi:hypothetical protein